MDNLSVHEDSFDDCLIKGRKSKESLILLQFLQWARRELVNPPKLHLSSRSLQGYPPPPMHPQGPRY